jgi:multicomponent Na+:H+ antiporter subunit A
LGGLWRDLPVTAAITGVAALSMAGIPPFNGFYSKELLFAAAWDVATASGGLAWLYPVVAVLASIFTVLYSLRFLWMFVGEHPSALDSSDTGTGDNGVGDTIHRPSALLVAPPAVLAGLAAVIGVWPELAIDFIVQDGAAATGMAGESVEVHAKLPLELSGPAVMSLVTVGAGVALFPVYGRLRDGIDALHRGATVIHPERVYRGVLRATTRASDRLDAVVHTGVIRSYVWWVLAATCTITLVGYAATGTSPAVTGLDTPVAMVLVLGVAVLAALAVTVTPSHVTGVLTLGILGFMVAIFYILASGPDLALTQLVVETLLLLIFLIVIEEMPAFYIDEERAVILRDAALSGLVGVTAFISVLVAMPTDRVLTDTAEFYVEKAVPEGGGTNVVNVILTDFRALDTLGESVVIVLAALSVLAMLVMRNRGETQ